MTEHDTRPESVFELFDLEDRVALITGGSKGLGESMALGLAQAGAATILCSRDAVACDEAAAKIADATGRECMGMALDVTDEGSVSGVFEQVQRRFGRIDVLINSAGINERHPIEDCPLEAFRRVLAVNLTGAWLCCREAMRSMRARRGGSIINVGSALGAVGLPERTPYCSAKAGLLGLTRTVALEGAPDNVRCNAICPGPFLTEMNRPLLNEPEKVRAILGRTALDRWADLHEIRGAALFLASDASSYVTGSALYVDGGWTAQ